MHVCTDTYMDELLEAADLALADSEPPTEIRCTGTLRAYRSTPMFIYMLMEFRRVYRHVHRHVYRHV